MSDIIIIDDKILTSLPLRLTADTLRQLQGKTERAETAGDRERVDTIMKMIDSLEGEIQAGAIYLNINTNICFRK